MVLRIKTDDNGVRSFPKSGQTKEIKQQNTIRSKKQSGQIQPISGGGEPHTREQIKNISRNSKKFV